MGLSDNNTKRNLPPGIELFPGEIIEKQEKSGLIKLFEATSNGGFIECGGEICGGENYNLMDVINESVVLITNFRIYYQLQPSKNFSKSLSSSSLSSLSDTIYPRAVHIPHSSISQIDESHNQITLTLKLSSVKYLFKFSKQKPNQNRVSGDSLCNEFSCLLKKYTNPSSIENLFAFCMGESEINNNKKEGNERKKRELTNFEKFYEDLLDANTSDDDDDDDFARRGLDLDKCKRIQKLGWSKGYKVQKEFERMQMSKESWNIVSYNEDFSLSPTYPKEFILPSRTLKKDVTFACESFDTNTDDSYEISTAFQSSSEFFEKLVNFRKNGRFPIICWKRGHNVLMRSGQPMVSILGWRGIEDELLIKDVVKAINEEHQQVIKQQVIKQQIIKQQIINNSKHSNKNKKIGNNSSRTNTKFCILDARSYSAALSNGLTRGGYENCENYPNTTLHFLGLSNIHAISSSHSSLLNAITTCSSSSKWYSALESTGWLNHVAELLKAAGGKEGVVGKIVDENANVLVHCTDGWDRTTQLVSLAQIMLDPFYRTIKGFQILIEKEWVALGHPFRARGELPKNLRNNNSIIPPTCEHSDSRSNCQEPITIPSAPAPVFLLFLTCVHHLLQQFPSSFEYNDFFLLCLARAAAGNSPYGDFLCNSECEREYVQLREKTKSIWTWVREHKPWFRNTSYYQKTRNYDNIGNLFDEKWKNDVLRPETEARLITLWNEYYFPKNDLSITLLSAPSGCEIPFHTGLISDSRSHQSPEFVLIKLLMKKKEKRIAEKVWKVWRSFVLEKKSKSANKIIDGKEEENDDNITRSGELDIELIGSSILQDNGYFLPENLKKGDVNKRIEGKNKIVEDNDESKFLLVTPPEKSNLNFDKDHYLTLSSQINLSPSAFSELLPAKEDYFSEEQQKPVYPNEMENSSSSQQLVYLCQHQKIDDDSNMPQTLTELLQEAQSDDHYLCQSKCHDSVLVDLLKEAQLDNNSLLPTYNATRQRRNIPVNTTAQNITRTSRTSSTSPSRSCRSSIICPNNSNHCDFSSTEISSNNSSPDIDFVFV